MNKNLLTLALIFFYAVSSYAQAPTITSFSPDSGAVGTLVTITGTNLSSPTALTIGGVAAVKISSTATSLVGMVMPGAATGAVAVTTAGGTATSTDSFTVMTTRFPISQQGPKLVGTGAVGQAQQGSAVAISADGNTAIVGGPYDRNDTGAVWIFVRSGTTWSQQGPKLVGAGLVGTPGNSTQIEFGNSVAISADGNTALVGAPGDSNGTGAACVFVRTGTTWAQQGPKLFGAGAAGSLIGQGVSVSISADGNTALISAPEDSNGKGALWVFARSGGIWSQQGPKLTGTGAQIYANLGSVVSLSADGNTAIALSTSVNYDYAAWVFTRSGTVWSQQAIIQLDSLYGGFFNSIALSADGNIALIGPDSLGACVYVRAGGVWSRQGPVLTGTGTVGLDAWQGSSVALSADGNTAIIGRPIDSFYISGAVWVFKRSGTIWAQQGYKLVGTGAVDSSIQGFSVSLSADGSTAIVGGPYDNTYQGAAWIFTSDSSMCSPLSSSESRTICPGQSYHGHTTTGTYRDVLTNALGCDSIVTLQLSVDTITANFALASTGTAHLWDIINLCTGNGLTYSWSWGDGSANSTGDTASHTYAAAGFYDVCVQVTDSMGCTASYCDSSTYLYRALGIVYVHVVSSTSSIDEVSTSSIHLYPNPATSSFTLAVDAAMIGTSYTFSDVTGRTIYSHVIEKEKTTLSLDGLSSGLYFLHINGMSYKLVKE